MGLQTLEIPPLRWGQVVQLSDVGQELPLFGSQCVPINLWNSQDLVYHLLALLPELLLRQTGGPSVKGLAVPTHQLRLVVLLGGLNMLQILLSFAFCATLLTSRSWHISYIGFFFKCF